MAAKKSKKAPFRAGTIALVGRPNVGKSTLLNAILGERLAIVSHHPQTTRDRIAGILTTDDAQFVFQDTPGLHAAKSRLGKRMNDVATGTAEACDVIVLVVDVSAAANAEVRPEDTKVVASLPKDRPVVLVVNKIDRVAEKAKLIEVLASFGAMRDFAAVVPISAKKRDGVDRLLKEIAAQLPEGAALYPPDELSDKPVRFFVAELVREQVLLRTREEVPHGVAVTIDAYEEPSPKRKTAKVVTKIKLTVHVAKDSHKGIIIGQGGQMLAAIGTAARRRAEGLVGSQVHLDIKVKATPGWFDDDARLLDLGYADPKRASV
ncbi:MAG: GTPase Era [Labilithrix sp.]|nr:GTPase Era [Labilithrix sp.]MCW5816285.1 GTPase Era [Labilithrix sp.]